MALALVAAAGGAVRAWTLFRASLLMVTACCGTAVCPRVPLPPMEVTGVVNLNEATEEQLMLLPSVGPLEAERIVAWRTKHSFKRTSDLRRVKGFGHKTFKKLEPFLDIKGDTTLAAGSRDP
jgi:competence ComEA-like helix-hairpin-helix protein